MHIAFISLGQLTHGLLHGLAAKEGTQVTAIVPEVLSNRRHTACQGLATWYGHDLRILELPTWLWETRGPITTDACLWTAMAFSQTFTPPVELWWWNVRDCERRTAWGSPSHIDTIKATLHQSQPTYDAAGTLQPKLELETPLATIDDRDILHLAAALGVPLSLTWDCERQCRRPCRECAGCLQRRRLFQLTNLEDPLEL